MGLTFCGLVAAVVWMALDRTQAHAPPIEMFTAEMTRTVARPGEAVWVEVDRIRHRYCSGESHMFWLSPTGDVIQAGIEPTSPSKELGRRISRFSKTIPAKTPPGRWCYAPKLIYDCDDRRYVVEQPAACLTVLPPAE